MVVRCLLEIWRCALLYIKDFGIFQNIFEVTCMYMSWTREVGQNRKLVFLIMQLNNIVAIGA